MKKILLSLLLLMIVSTPAYADRPIYIATANSYQEPKGSSLTDYQVTVDFKPEKIILKNQTESYTITDIIEENSPFYDIWLSKEAIDFYLPNPSPTSITVFGENESRTFHIPETAIWPVPGYTTIQEPYGAPRNNQYKYHHGVDITTPPEGTPVVASLSGQVIFAGEITERAWYGKHIIIEENDCWYIYGHLSSFNIAVGDYVTQGTQIGISGNTMYGGKTTTHHLHFEVRDITKGKTVHSAKDPFTVLPKPTFISPTEINVSSENHLFYQTDSIGMVRDIYLYVEKPVQEIIFSFKDETIPPINIAGLFAPPKTIICLSQDYLVSLSGENNLNTFLNYEKFFNLKSQEKLAAIIRFVDGTQQKLYLYPR